MAKLPSMASGTTGISSADIAASPHCLCALYTTFWTEIRFIIAIMTIESNLISEGGRLTYGRYRMAYMDAISRGMAFFYEQNND
jgi:hypothetical protein